MLGGTIRFSDGTGWVELTGYGATSATLDDFQRGDTIDLTGLAYGPGVSVSVNGNTAQVLTGGAVAASFALTGGSYTTSDFLLSSDGAGGTSIASAHVMAG